MFLHRRVIIARLGSSWCVSIPSKSFAFDNTLKVLASKSVLIFDTVHGNVCHKKHLIVARAKAPTTFVCIKYLIVVVWIKLH